MRYGFFDDDKREYVITTPHTPAPWLNYLGCEDFFGLITNNGGGYCFYRDARLQRLVRYRYNGVPGDVGGRFLYIKEEGKPAWSPAFCPCNTALDSYRCRHGLGYTVFESQRDALFVEQTLLVPLGENMELHRVRLVNRGAEQKRVKLYAAVEWCLWNALDDMTNFQRNLNVGEVEVEGDCVYHTTEYRERRDHYAYFGANEAFSGFDTDRDTFLGRFGDWKNPEAVEMETSFLSVAHGRAPIAVLRYDITLAPGEEKTLVFRLGYGKNPAGDKFIRPGVIRKDDERRTAKAYAASADVDAVLDALRAYWDDLLGAYHTQTGDEKLDRMVNIWNQYQCMATFNLSRSASLYESGIGRGMGFRDGCQDLLGFVHLVPERARQRILDLAAIQFEDGSTYHQYQPLTKRGNTEVGGGFNDDPLWLVACTAAYIRETGDFTILDVPVPFDNQAGSEAPLMEHLRRSVRYTMARKGPHGLPLIGRADWNDCLNLNCFSDTPGESFQTATHFESGVAESVFIAVMFIKYAREYAELCERRGLIGEAAEVLLAAEEMERATEEYGWDGAWYLRAYDAFGNKVGSSVCEEGKIYIEPQGFVVMAGIGIKNGRGEAALMSVRERLSGKYGLELLSPCYTRYHRELGEITSYPPGYKENGSVFCHNNPWAGIAESILGHAEEAFDIYRRICPAHWEDEGEIRRAEPYVYAQTVAGREAATEGEAKNSWLTGTAAWSFVFAAQHILGVAPEYDGLRVKPCLPAHIGEVTLKRRFRGADYFIHIKRTGAYSLALDGVSLTGDTVPMEDGRREYRVEVTV